MIRVLIADDQALLRGGLRLLLDARQRFVDQVLAPAVPHRVVFEFGLEVDHFRDRDQVNLPALLRA